MPSPMATNEKKRVMCHCGHDLFYHATNGECLIQNCPCRESFQAVEWPISPNLKAEMAAMPRVKWPARRLDPISLT